MAGKIEKLKEVNENLKNLLIQLETRMFVENINVSNFNQKNEDKKPAINIVPNQ
jgi:hypothetical protein